MNLQASRNFIYFLISSLVLSFIVGNRGDTNDTQIYYDIFKKIDFYNIWDYYGFYSDTGVEVGWGIYCKIISFFSNSSLILFSLFSFFTFYFIYCNTKNLNLRFYTVMMFYLPTGFFLMQQFMQIRQGLAIPIVILASLLFLDGRRKLALILFFISILFHQIAFSFIIVFLFFIIVNKKIDIGFNKKKFLLFNILILLLGVLIARKILLPLASGVFDRLISYSTSEYAEQVGFFSISNIKYYLEFVLLLCFTKNKLLQNKKYIFLFFCFTIGLTLRIAFYDFAILSGRLSNVFLLVEIFILPMLLNSVFKRKIVLIISIIYFILIFYVTWVFQASQFIEKSYFIPLG